MAQKPQRDKEKVGAETELTLHKLCLNRPDVLQAEYHAMYDRLPDLSPRELAKLKWWNDIEPSRLKSR